MAEAGRWRPAVITALIAAVLTLCGLYAYSGAGLLPPFPLLAFVLSAISTIYTLRGLAYTGFKLFKPELATPFFQWSSLICLIIGVVHAVGLVEIWDGI